MRKYRKSAKDGLRICNRCDRELPANADVFLKDASRHLGLAYECKECHRERKKGRDRRKERWTNMTEGQREMAAERNRRYAKTPRGRAVFLRKAYERVDECDFSSAELAELLEQECYHCGTLEHPRGLDRIDNSKGHLKENVVPSCAYCNFARGDRFTFDEMKVIGACIRSVLDQRK